MFALLSALHDFKPAKQVLEREISKAKNSMSKNATKFKREVTMPEIEDREDKSASENAKALKHVFKSKMKSIKEEKWYSEEGYGRKHQESIRESYYDRDSKDLHAGICANPQKGPQCMNRIMIDLSD